MNKKFLIAAVAIWVAALGLAGFGYLRPDVADTRDFSGGEGQTVEQTTKRGSEQTSEQTSRQSVAGEAGAPSGPDGPVELRLTGEPGTSISGSCTVDGEERRLSGETPQSFSFEAGERLKCEMSSSGGPLQTSFSDGEGTSTSQRIGPGDSTLELTYTGDSFSSSTRSESQTSASQTSSSQVTSSQSSSSVTRSGSE